MPSIFRVISVICILRFILFPSFSYAQTETKEHRKGEFYFSWGYNTDWYTNSTIYVDQPSLKNNYSFDNIHAHDHRGWDEGLFNEAISIPQYNYRIGYFFNDEKDLGIELNFDHVKYIVTDGQQAHITGTLNGAAVYELISFSQSKGFVYVLNNGANFFLFNITKRWHVMKPKDIKGKVKIDFIGKAGVGPVVPHVQNTLFGGTPYGGQADPHFQLGGWDTGVEGTIRATFFEHVYLEYANKLDYARYSGMRIYDGGTARQSFGTYEMILNLGYTFPMGKRVAVADKPAAQ